MKTLYIKDKITINTSINNNGYVAYLALLCLMKKNIKQYYINANLLSYTLDGNFPVLRPMYDSLNDGIINLVDNKIINVVPEIDKTKRRCECVADVSYIYEKEGFFTNVDIADIRWILSKVDQFASAISIIRFYIYILSTLHKKKDDELMGVGFTSIEAMSEKIGLNEKTIYSYLNKLESYELLYLHKPTCSVIKNEGGISEIPSTYGRFKDKKKVTEAGVIYESKYQKKISRSNKNNLRSLAQKYNVIYNCALNGNKVPYEDNEIKEIYLGVKELNEKYEINSRNDRIKDLSIFKYYDFYEE
jgi:hypothetical protein